MKNAEEWFKNVIWSRLNNYELSQMIKAVQQDARAELLERIKELEAKLTKANDPTWDKQEL